MTQQSITKAKVTTRNSTLSVHVCANVLTPAEQVEETYSTDTGELKLVKFIL